MHTVRQPSSSAIPRPLKRDPEPLDLGPPVPLLLLILAGEVAVVPADNKEALLLELVCVTTVLATLTVVLLAIDDVDDTTRSGGLGAVIFAIMFASVDSFCSLVPLLMKLTLETLADLLDVADEFSFWPFPMR